MTPPEQVERALARIAGVCRPMPRCSHRPTRGCRRSSSAGRNGIWPFVLRNLIRPVWLSRPDQRADVLIGNPPWVAYRHLSPEMKPRLRDACRAMNLWVGGVLATQQDISALFWARGAERYLKPGGTIAFVLPYAALNRPAFAGLRRGSYGSAERADHRRLEPRAAARDLPDLRLRPDRPSAQPPEPLPTQI